MFVFLTGGKQKLYYLIGNIIADVAGGYRCGVAPETDIFLIPVTGDRLKDQRPVAVFVAHQPDADLPLLQTVQNMLAVPPPQDVPGMRMLLQKARQELGQQVLGGHGGGADPQRFLRPL